MQNKSQGYRTSIPFELLKTFTDDELNNFEKLINSGYLSTKQGLDVLLKNLKKNALFRSAFTPDIQCIIYNSLYPKERAEKFLSNSQKKKLSKAMNELLNAAEKFLMFEKVKESDEYEATLLYSTLINRKQLLLYNKRLKAIEKKLLNMKKQGEAYYNQCYNIQREKARLSFINNTLQKADNYDELQYYADIKYLLQKLQYHLAKITLQRRYAHKTFNLKPFDLLQNLLELPEYKSNPLIQLYLLNIKLVESEEESTFIALSKLLKGKQTVIPADFLNIFYVNLTNYCAYQLSKGDSNYYKYIFKIYGDMDEGKLLMTDKFIELAILKNMITASCQVDAFDWAFEKLNSYIKYVPKNIRKPVFEYNSGIIAFHQKKYEVALTHFAKVRKIDNTHELSFRIVQLMCFYETDTTYETYTQQIIKSLKTYIHDNKKLTKRQKTSHFNFIRILNKLYKLKEIPDRRSQRIEINRTLPKLKAQILKFVSISNKQWLFNKIEILEGI